MKKLLIMLLVLPALLVGCSSGSKEDENIKTGLDTYFTAIIDCDLKAADKATDSLAQIAVAKLDKDACAEQGTIFGTRTYSNIKVTDSNYATAVVTVESGNKYDVSLMNKGGKWVITKIEAATK